MSEASPRQQVGHDPSDFEEQLRVAEDAVAVLADNFTGLAKDELDQITAELEAAKARPGDNGEIMARIFSICHNIKGQAGSFGYDLLTKVAALLCDFVRGRGTADDAVLKVVEGHIMAMHFITDRDIQGDGGEVGQKLITKLTDLALRHG